MKTRDLKAGDKVFIREDLKDGKEYQGIYYVREMGVGPKTISDVHPSGIHFITSNDNLFFHYSSEMIDWDKTVGHNNTVKNSNTINIAKEYLNSKFGCLNANRGVTNENTFKEIIQYGECRNEITKATTYDGREITVKNNNEKNDMEKAVMLLMLKSLGVTYRDVKKEVEKVKIKWVPKRDEKYYWINSYTEIERYTWDGYDIDKKLLESGNCFKTKEGAERKAEEIKEVLRGDYDGK